MGQAGLSSERPGEGRSPEGSSHRLDQLLVQRGLFPSRERARRAVLAGSVAVDGRRERRPGRRLSPGAHLEAVSSEPYVSRGGSKLAAALDAFGVNPAGRVCLDVGASTGGFTDCLLQRRAARVYAVDVGHGQLVENLRRHPRVVSREGVNARYLGQEEVPEPCDLVVVDLSFISLLKVVPALLPLMATGGWLVVLVKPQFEVGPGGVGKGGIVRDDELRRRVIRQRIGEIAALGFELVGEMDCPVHGADGNREALACFQKEPEEGK